MGNRFREYSRYNLFIAFEIVAIISASICMINSSYAGKELLFILPLGFFFISIPFAKNFQNITENIPKLIIECLCFVRLSVLPFLYSFNLDRQIFEGNTNISTGFNMACILMVYEFFAIQLAIYIFENVRIRHSIRRLRVVSGNVDISKYLIIVLLLFVILSPFLFPYYSIEFRTIIDLSSENFTTVTEANYSVGTIERAVNTLYVIGFQIFRILFPAFLLRMMYEKGRSKLAAFILIIGCVLQFFFITSTFAESIVSSLVILLYYIRLYPNLTRRTLILIGACSFGMIVVYFGVRYFVNTTVGIYDKNSGAIYYALQIMNSYFSGVDNVSAIFNIDEVHRFESFKSGLIGAIPFNSTIFWSQGHKLQYFYNYSNNSYGQIPPTIAAGYYYFGALLSPIISMFFTFLSLSFYKIASNTSTSLKYISRIFCSITFLLGIGMYSPTITLSWFFGWGVPMLILTAFTNDKSQKKSVNGGGIY